MRRKYPKTGQPGRYSRLTQEQIDSVREAHLIYMAARRARVALANQLDIDMPYFHRIATGVQGKKPAPAAPSY
jgi:hypothetical protein